MSCSTSQTSAPDAAAIAKALLQTSHQKQKDGIPEPVNMSVPWERSFGQEKLALMVPNVLSEDECNAIIQRCEEKGFKKALLNLGHGRHVMAADLRNSGRVTIGDEMAAEILFERLKHVIPDKIGPGGGSVFECVGLNELFRVLKYEENTDYFKPHTDGSFVRPLGWEGPGRPLDESYFTLMLYLNTPKKGGGTNFVSEEGSIHCYNPVVGQALMFDHSIRHEGAPVESGVKYAIRTNVMYRQVEDTALAEMVDAANHANRCILFGHSDHLWANCSNNPKSKSYNEELFDAEQIQDVSSISSDDADDQSVNWHSD